MGATVVLDRKGVRVDGEYRILLCASLFYFRVPAELWKDRIARLRDAGYTCVDVYFPWNFHERAPGEWDFTGGRDAARFLDMLADAGFYVMARPGPYICSEWDGGGIPAWVLASGTRVREDCQPFMGAVRRWYEKIIPLLATRQIGRGGSVILLQLDNELDFFDCPDPRAYIGALDSIARELGVTVPRFACAGQGSAQGAGGFAPGVEISYNFYPSSTDLNFDERCRTVTRTLATIDRPLLITETRREHSLLRRELANGAKLLGAYNQVGGTNFGFTNSINNWGKPWPLSFITSDYDSESMIDAAGRYRPEAGEGRLLAALIRALGESLAGAGIDESAAISAECDFPTSHRGPAVLRLADGGTLVCVPNLSATDGKARLRGPGFEFEAHVPASRAPLYPINVRIDRTGIDGRIVFSTAELFAIEEGRLLLYGETGAEVVLELGAGQKLRVTAESSPRVVNHGGRQLEIVILSREEAIERGPGQPWTPGQIAGPLRLAKLSRAVMVPHEPQWARTEGGSGAGINMEARGLYRGFALYDVGHRAGRPLLLQGAADVITAYVGKRRVDTRISAGQWQLYRGEAGTWRFRTESWGHSNFDDSRVDSLRLCSPKGIRAVFEVVKEQPLSGQWRFQPTDRWLPERLEYVDHPFDAVLDLDSWNSTRRPVIALYRADVQQAEGSEELALHLAGNQAETALYVNGLLTGVINPNDPWLAVPSGVIEGGRVRLELHCRKRDWSEPVGAATLFHLMRLEPTVHGFGEKQLESLRVTGGHDLPLPMPLDPDISCLVEFDLDGLERRCAFAVFECRDVKLTAIFNGRVVGRIFGAAGNRPFMTGGDSMRCYLPGPWYRDSANALVLFVEPIGEHPELGSLAVQYART